MVDFKHITFSLPPAQKKSTEEFLRIGQSLANYNPELILKYAEKQLDKEEMKPEKIHAPVLDLRAIVAAQQEAFREKFKPVIDPTPVNGTVVPVIFTAKPQFEFDQSQEDARKGILSEQFSCLIGAAGTGKTKTENDLLDDLKHELGMVKWKSKDRDGNIIHINRLSIVFCAFTGRAVEQMKLKLPKEYHDVCGTIHGDRVLTYIPEFYDDFDDDGLPKTKMRFVPTYNESNKLPYDVYIIDEAGMLSVDLWNTLRAAMLPNAKVILVGDINQLPPVYGRSILGYAMTKWPVFELTKIHRQAMDNPIIANAHRILNGQTPIAVRGKFDLDDLKDKGSNGSQERFIAILRYLQGKNEFDPMKDGAIVPHNVGPLGQLQLNELILPFFNPHDPKYPRSLIRTGIAVVHFAVGDKVMMLTNDKDNNLTNGQIGKVVSISLNGKYANVAGMVKQTDLEKMKNVHISEDHEFELEADDVGSVVYSTEGAKKENELSQRQASHIVTVDFGTPELSIEVSFATAGEFRRIAHAYIITCHKSQGGEYPTVIILVHSANNISFSREWLYTAVTRARERVVLVYNQRGLNQCLSRQRVKGQTLKEKIESFLKISEEDTSKENAILPNLPAPKGMRK